MQIELEDLDYQRRAVVTVVEVVGDPVHSLN